MTHTLHPEIEKAIKETVEAAYEIHQAEAGKPFRGILHGIIIDNLGKYLLPPSQHLKDEPFPTENKELKKEIKQFRKSLQEYPDTLGDDEQFWLLFKEYFWCFISKSRDNEPLPESNDIGVYNIDQMEKEYHRGYKDGHDQCLERQKEPTNVEELKQSTPKIENIEINYVVDDSGVIPVGLLDKIDEIIDYINNKD